MKAKTYDGWTQKEIETYRKKAKKRRKKFSPKKKAEIQKNKHQQRKQNGYYEKRRQNEREFKRKCVVYKGGKCMKCGLIDHPSVYDFHHRDPKMKDFGICKYPSRCLDETVKKELDKCDILCANCHRKEHHLK